MRLYTNEQPQGGKYGIRLSLGAQECEVYGNVMSDSTRYGVFFYRGSDEAEVRTLRKRVWALAVLRSGARLSSFCVPPRNMFLFQRTL